MIILETFIFVLVAVLWWVTPFILGTMFYDWLKKAQEKCTK